MKKETNYYFISIFTTYILFLVIVIIYFSFLNKIIIIPECPIHKYLDLYCPACGITRSLISLLKLDILSSIYYNPIVLYTFITVNIYILNELVYLLFKKKLNINYKKVVMIGLIILFVNCILKNIMGIEMLFIK